ncbi:MAG TPA: hypothetical protein VLB44_00075 [Kofleriaceae bacterium]|nr:hypothetical protein [Kofleriaceae bacterium]
MRELVTVLAKWKLVDKSPTLFRLDDESEIPAKRAFTGELPANLRLQGDWIDDTRVVRSVVGPSAYGLKDRRYIAGTDVILGTDFKVLNSEEHGFVVATPPKNGRAKVEESYAYAVSQHQVYPASWTTTPPKVTASGYVSPPRGFSGVWRSGLIIDCHKDVPTIAEDHAPLPAKGLKTALERAFGTSLVELGWYH